MRATSDSTSASSASGAATRLTRPRALRLSASMKSPVSSISIACLRGDVARQGHARRRAEQPEVDAADGELRVGRGDCQVAHRHQLAARRGGDAVHARNHRHRQALDRQHHAACSGRTACVVVQRRLRAHLLQVVAGAERLAGGGQHDGSRRLVVRRSRPTRACNAASIASRQGVELLRPVQRQRDDAARILRRSTSGSSVVDMASPVSLDRAGDFARSRSTNFWILPVEVFGISSKRISRGTL